MFLKLLGVALPFAFVSSIAFAAPLTMEELQAATKLAGEDFAKNQAAHAEHFTGFKTWKSGDEARVKIYVTHQGSNMEFNYQCMKHGDELMCHAQ